MFRPRRVVVFLLLLTLAACEEAAVFTPTPTPIPSLDTAWGRSQALTWSPTFDSPALAVSGTTALLGAFEILDDLPTLVIYRDGLRLRSNITGSRPFSLSVFAATENGTLALWLDDDNGTQKLYTARLSDTGFAEFAAIPVSSGAATRYTSAQLPDGSIWAVWTSPLTAEPTLVGSRIDTEGRPRISQALQPDADYPALAVTNTGHLFLYWLGGARADLYRAEVTDSGLIATQLIAAAPLPQDSAAQLLRFDVGLDTDHAYLFWQRRTSQGATDVWTLTAPLAGSSTTPAQRLAVTTTAETAQTGFNHGTAYAAAAHPDGDTIDWAQPARGQHDTLPVAAVIADSLGVVYFRDGAVVASQTLVPLGGQLIASPTIATDSQRDLLLAWWKPDTLQDAILYVVNSER